MVRITRAELLTLSDFSLVPLTRGKVSIIDAADAEWVLKYKWRALLANKRFWYATRSYNTLLHREILNAPEGMRVDHRNRNTLDNRRVNLRLATYTQDHGNSKKQKLNTSSKYKGVSWDASTQKWRAQITVEGKPRHLGLFVDERDAGRTYDDAARDYFGEFARVNFPKSGEHSAHE